MICARIAMGLGPVHPIVTRLVDEEALTKMAAAKAGGTNKGEG